MALLLKLLILFALRRFSSAFPINADEQINIISRSEWGAREPTFITPLSFPLTYIIIHHSEGVEPNTLVDGIAATKSIQNFHMDTRGWADIGYSFLIGGDGSIFEGRGWENVGAHTKGWNNVGYGICFMGNFMNKNPTPSAIRSAGVLIMEAVEKGYIRPDYTLKGHRQMGSTDCPGDTLFELIQTWPHFKE